MKTLFLSALVVAAASAYADPKTWTDSLVGVGNTQFSGGITALDESAAQGQLTAASVTQSFTGMNGAGDTQTMTFSGAASNSAQFGRLHSYTEGHLTNSYYNAGNRPYANGNGGVANADGSPDFMSSLGLAGFDDTLQFGGALQDGYKARYVFHVDGTNTGQGYLADLGVKIGDDADESFFAFDPGLNAADWTTVDHLIDGTNPTPIHVQFSNQVVFNNYELAEGQSYDGVSDFSSTLTLAAIIVVDGNGNPVNGVTITSGSGTIYPAPEPASLLALGGGLLTLRRGRRWSALRNPAPRA